MDSVSNIDINFLTMGERNLWQACIRQHIQDLFLPRTTKKNSRLREEAHNFLFKDSTMYLHVCYCAGYNPVILRMKIKNLYQEKLEKKESLIRKIFKNHAA
jgi:hypothetical protein